jgi:hypothetical protein
MRASAQNAKTRSNEQLDQMLAPIARCGERPGSIRVGVGRSSIHDPVRWRMRSGAMA